jgi:hypothetical protein
MDNQRENREVFWGRRGEKKWARDEKFVGRAAPDTQKVILTIRFTKVKSFLNFF